MLRVFGSGKTCRVESRLGRICVQSDAPQSTIYKGGVYLPPRYSSHRIPKSFTLHTPKVPPPHSHPCTASVQEVNYLSRAEAEAQSLAVADQERTVPGVSQYRAVWLEDGVMQHGRAIFVCVSLSCWCFTDILQLVKHGGGSDRMKMKEQYLTV